MRRRTERLRKDRRGIIKERADGGHEEDRGWRERIRERRMRGHMAGREKTKEAERDGEEAGKKEGREKEGRRTREAAGAVGYLLAIQPPTMPL